MLSNALIITYTIMCFLSLQAITLILMIIRHSDSGNTKLLKATRDFVIVSVVLGLFYYITYYREMVLSLFEADAFSRGLDAIIFYAMGYSWIKLVDAISQSKNPKLNWWRKSTNGVFLVLMFLSACAYIFLLDENYTTKQPWAEVTVIVSEVCLGITVVVFTLAYVIHGFRDLPDRLSCIYVVIISIFVNFNNLWNNTVVIFVFIKATTLNLVFSNLYGATSILLLIINLLTILYIYKKDFSPFFFGKKSSPPKSLSEEEVLDLVAETHRLTERERDVLVLAYHGLTNPDIAEKLFISRHTVKRHMHNIFEKLDVSTRAEMMHLIQSQPSAQQAEDKQETEK